MELYGEVQIRKGKEDFNAIIDATFSPSFLTEHQLTSPQIFVQYNKEGVVSEIYLMEDGMALPELALSEDDIQIIMNHLYNTGIHYAIKCAISA